jgi:hypothetical protein
MDETDVVSHLENVITAVNHFTRMFDREEDVIAAMALHQIFVVRPTDTSRQNRKLEFVSSHVLGFVSRAHANQDHLTRQTFYKRFSGHTWFGASVGHIFETSVLLWLRHAPDNSSLDCYFHGTKKRRPLNIPTCGENMRFFSNVAELKNVDRH